MRGHGHGHGLVRHGVGAGIGGELYGMWFDGTDDYVETASAGLPFTESQAFEVEAEFQTTGTGEAILSDQENSGSFRGFLLNINASGQVQVEMANVVANRLNVRTNDAFNDGEKHLVKMTYDGSKNASGVTFTIDGSVVAQDGSPVDSLTSTIESGLPLRIGSRGATALLFGGFIGKVSIRNGSGTLVNRWVGDGNTNADWEDQVGSDDGTVNGSPSRAISTDGGNTWAEET